MVHVSQSARAMDHVHVGSAGDLHDSAELAGLQRHLCNTEHESRRYCSSELHGGIFRCVRPRRRYRSDHCQWEWILVAAIRLWGLLLSLRSDILRWLLLRRLRLSLCNALLQFCHGSLRLETDCLWPLRLGDARGRLQSIHWDVRARLQRLDSLWQSKCGTGLQSVHRNLCSDQTRFESERSVGELLRVTREPECYHGPLLDREWNSSRDFRVARRKSRRRKHCVGKHGGWQNCQRQYVRRARW